MDTDHIDGKQGHQETQREIDSSSVAIVERISNASGLDPAINQLYDSSTISFIAISLVAREVNKMPVPVGLLFTGLILRTILGVVVIAALVFLFWKIGKLADAYTEKLKAK